MKQATFYDCLKKFMLLGDKGKFKNMEIVKRKRNTIKIIKVYKNGKFEGYLKLDKLNRNLHINHKEDGEIILSTDY